MNYVKSNVHLQLPHLCLRLSLQYYLSGRLVQSVASLTANQGVAGSSPGSTTYFRGDLL